MKKVVSLVVGVIFAMCAMVLAPRVWSAQESLARLVPQDAAYFDTSVGLDEIWASVVKSNFWKQLTSLRFWDETGVTAGLEEFATGFSEEIGAELSTENIMSLLGKEVAVAVYATPGETPGISGYLLCRGNPKSVAEDFVQKTFGAMKRAAEEAGEDAFKDSVYKGTKITSIKSDEIPVEIEYGFVGDVFALGVGTTPPQLKKIVDLAGGTGDSLADDPNFKKVVAASKMTTGRYAGTFYVDLPKVGQLFSALEGAVPMPMAAGFSGMKESLSMPIVIGGTGYIDRGEVVRLVSLPTGETSDKLIELSLGTPPAAGTTINYVPASTLAYAAANSTPDWEKMWPLLLEQWEKQGAAPAMNMILGQIEGALGIKTAEDVIPWVGNEFAVLFADIDTKAGFPYPKFALMVKIKDKPKAKAFLQKFGAIIKELSEETGFKFEKSLHQGYSLNSVTIMMPIPMPISLTPCYGVVDDFLIVASSADLVKEMIDTSKGSGKSLASDPTFKALNIPARTISSGFCNWRGSMEEVKAVAAWVVQFTQAQPAGESVKAAVENYVVPIANCLSALESLGFYQVNQGNMSAQTYIMRVKDLPAM
ncbi:DUF3352 domain-containing protein [bacterium]|nr:DUF3352 domain-containing protein [bacterium]